MQQTKFELRDYQKECISVIESQPPGAYVCQLATGLGKTAIFSHIPRHGRVLVLAHREELIYQPARYFDCPVGFEMASYKSAGEEVVIASVQSLVRRLDRFGADDFDMIITDECHHSAAKTYRKIYDHFHPRLHLGFSATVGRGDKVRLDDIYSRVIFSRDLRWGISNGWLSDIYCRRANIGFDLRAVRTRHGDYAPGELEQAMDGTADAIAEAYRGYAEGATLIFAVSVAQANEIASRIPGAAVVTGETKDRADIVRRFTNGEIPCIVNCMVFTEGTDVPRVETVIIARPTQSDGLYAQMVGRGLRTFPGKTRLNLIDCVGVTGNASLCTAPSLLGVDMDSIPERCRNRVQGELFDLPLKAAAAADTPESWIRNMEVVDLWAREQEYDTHGVNWFRLPDGSMRVSLPDKQELEIGPMDEFGNTTFRDERMPMQSALDEAYKTLLTEQKDARSLWDVDAVNHWGKAPATDKQLDVIRRKCRGFDTTGLTKGQASMILNRVLGAR